VGVKEKEATKPKKPYSGSFYTLREAEPKPTSIEVNGKDGVLSNQKGIRESKASNQVLATCKLESASIWTRPQRSMGGGGCQNPLLGKAMITREGERWELANEYGWQTVETLRVYKDKH